jgi:hypothetical protein
MIGDDHTGWCNQDDLHWNYYFIVDGETLNKVINVPEETEDILLETDSLVGSINL